MITANAILTDAVHLVLQEPINLEPGVRVKVSIWRTTDEEGPEWTNASLQALNAAYGEDEPEYEADLIKEPNPVYKS